MPIFTKYLEKQQLERERWQGLYENGTGSEKVRAGIELGRICAAAGETEQAGRYFWQTHQMCNAYADSEYLTKVRENLLAGFISLGEQCRKKGDLQGTHDYYTKATKVGERLAESGTEKDILRLSGLWTRIEIIYRKEGNLDCAWKCGENSLWHIGKLEGRIETASGLRTVCFCFEEHGKTYEEAWNIGQAIECYEKEVQAREKLAEMAKDEESLRSLSSACLRAAEACRKKKDSTEKAKNYYEKYLQIIDNINRQDDAEQELKDDMADNFIGRGNAEQNQTDNLTDNSTGQADEKKEFNG